MFLIMIELMKNAKKFLENVFALFYSFKNWSKLLNLITSLGNSSK